MKESSKKPTHSLSKEGTFRRILGVFEENVRQHQMENGPDPDYRAMARIDADIAREKVVKMFRHEDQQVVKYRDVLKKIHNETMDPNIQMQAREALYGKYKSNNRRR